MEPMIGEKIIKTDITSYECWWQRKEKTERKGTIFHIIDSNRRHSVAIDLLEKKIATQVAFVDQFQMDPRMNPATECVEQNALTIPSNSGVLNGCF